MNIGGLLTKTARTFPDKPAVVYGEKRLTYTRFDERTNRLANALNHLGLEKGDRVALLQYNYPEMLESMFACFKAGYGAVPINFRLHPKEYSFIIAHSEAKAVVLSPEFNGPILEIRESIPEAKYLITLPYPGADHDDGPHGELLDYEELLSKASDKFSMADLNPDDLAWLFYTSGTTGMPKGAMLTHRNLLAMTMNFYADICPGFGFDEAILHAAPLSHGSGLYALPNVGKGAANIIPKSKSFDPEWVFHSIQEHKATNMFAAPTMIKLMIDNPALKKYDYSSMKALVYGGAPMLVEDLKKAMAKLGPCLVQLYGQGESPMTITYLSHRDHVLSGTTEQLRRLASVGVARTDVEVKVFDLEDRELPVGETGEIVTRSELVMKGYWKNPEATVETLRNGWLHTGDLGYMDERGYLFLMDRSKDMIISGGENIYPREIEEVLIRHHAVREVAVIGVPDPKWGEAVKAVVALRKGCSVEAKELITFCKENLASYKKPQSIDFVDELPKNNFGKILKRDLKAPYWKGRDRRV